MPYNWAQHPPLQPKQKYGNSRMNKYNKHSGNAYFLCTSFVILQYAKRDTFSRVISKEGHNGVVARPYCVNTNPHFHKLSPWSASALTLTCINSHRGLPERTQWCCQQNYTGSTLSLTYINSHRNLPGRTQWCCQQNHTGSTLTLTNLRSHRGLPERTNGVACSKAVLGQHSPWLINILTVISQERHNGVVS